MVARQQAHVARESTSVYLCSWSKEFDMALELAGHRRSLASTSTTRHARQRSCANPTIRAQHEFASIVERRAIFGAIVPLVPCPNCDIKKTKEIYEDFTHDASDAWSGFTLEGVWDRRALGHMAIKGCTHPSFSQTVPLLAEALQPHSADRAASDLWPDRLVAVCCVGTRDQNAALLNSTLRAHGIL